MAVDASMSSGSVWDLDTTKGVFRESIKCPVEEGRKAPILVTA